MKLIFNFLLIFTFQAIASDKEVVIATTEFPPITSMELENYGYLTDIVIQAFEEVGYKVKIELYPWARALKIAKEGKVDAAVGWHTKQREQWFYFPNLYHRKY
jgi:ABC-type tungstate transport system permease subunit